MSKWEIFWILKLDDIDMFLLVLTATSILSAVVWLFMWAAESDRREPDDKKLKIRLKNIRKWGIVFLIMFFITALFPSTKQYLTIMGGAYLTNNQKVIETGEKTFELLDTYMDNKLKELKGEDKNVIK